jgi:hypothetical protein
MSEHFPERLWIGESQDYDGIVIILDPQTERQVVIVIETTSAMRAGKRLWEVARKRKDREKEFAASAVVRERPARLDS